MGEAIAGVTDVVIGRTLWQEWSAYWPMPRTPSARSSPVRKHVVTSTLTGDLGWNSTAINGYPLSYVQQLQQHGDGDIAITGGIETIRSLFLAGVIDALTLTVHPVATDQGRRLFDESVPLTRLTLLSGTRPALATPCSPTHCAADLPRHSSPAVGSPQGSTDAATAGGAAIEAVPRATPIRMGTPPGCPPAHAAHRTTGRAASSTSKLSSSASEDVTDAFEINEPHRHSRAHPARAVDVRR